jgi:hypothetical protein
MIPSDFVKALKPHVDFIPVCAEMEIGLGVPRDSIRIVSIKGEQRLVQPTTGLDATEKMRDFATQFLSSLPEVDGFIFEPFPEDLIELCRNTQCEWSGSELFEGREAARGPQRS